MLNLGSGIKFCFLNYAEMNRNQVRNTTTRNRPVQGFGCRTGNSRKLNLNPVCRILPDRKQVFLTENFKLPDLAGNFNFLEYGYLFDRKFLSTKINFFILTQKTTSIITE